MAALGKLFKSLLLCHKINGENKIGATKKKWKLWKSSSNLKKSGGGGGADAAVCDSSVTAAAVAVVVRAQPKDFNLIRQEWAAIRIQALFRAYSARRALRALRAVVRVQAIFRGRQVRKQVAVTLRCMQAVVRVQARVRARNVRKSPEGKTVQQLLDDHRNQADYVKLVEQGWCEIPGTADEVKAKLRRRQEGAIKRDRAMAYYLSTQGDAYRRFSGFKNPPRIPQFPQSPKRFSRGGHLSDSGARHRGGRGHDGLTGATVKVRRGRYKGYRGRVIEVKGTSVRVELESQMKVVAVDRNHITDNVAVTLQCETYRYGMGSETPMHPSQTPLHPYMTPMRDLGATPIHDGMRTPMRDRAWNPYAPMSPARDDWEDGNLGSWGGSPQYQPGSPPSRPYEAPTPGVGWASTPGGNYSEAGIPRDSSAYGNAPSLYLPSTPGGQPMTPNSASYLPGTPGGQPMTPATDGLDMMSLVLGNAPSLYLPSTSGGQPMTPNSASYLPGTPGGQPMTPATDGLDMVEVTEEKDVRSYMKLNEPRRQLNQLDSDGVEDFTTKHEPSESELMQITDPAESYIRDLLVASGLYFGSWDESLLRGDTYAKPIGNSVFEEVEESHKTLTENDASFTKDQSENGHKILLDLLNEALSVVLGPPSTLSRFRKKSCKSSMLSPPQGKELLKLVWENIRVSLYPSSDITHYSVHTLAAQHLSSIPWSGIINDEIDILGREVECLITNDLVEELTKDLL